MSSAAKTLPCGEWSIVLPGRRTKNKRSQRKSEGTDQPWVSTDLEMDKERESKLMQKLELCMKKLETSSFYEVFQDQMETSEAIDCFSKVLKSSGKMKMVIYGIGSVEWYEPPRLQLSLAMLMKRKFEWIGDIEVFDPVLSITETRVLEALGCSVLSMNEQGRREACEPTLFFMPHCEAVLYNNLLEANWKEDRLRNIALFGNSFKVYEQHVSFLKDDEVAESRKYVLAARRFATEFEIKTVSEDYFRAFLECSWHFFSPQGLHIVS
ncbi:uncharacterized protein [Phyllobates terribilis]|uniref:uncharacterized protein n=1 Tax=Phyllobates terribilis TaxID=111132 RepID=UPI003CCB21D3